MTFTPSGRYHPAHSLSEFRRVFRQLSCVTEAGLVPGFRALEQRFLHVTPLSPSRAIVRIPRAREDNSVLHSTPFVEYLPTRQEHVSAPLAGSLAE